MSKSSIDDIVTDGCILDFDGIVAGIAGSSTCVRLIAKGETMECIEIYTGVDGHSLFRHIEAFEVSPVNFKGITVSLSSPQACESVLLHEFNSDYFLGWHNPPSRQYVVVLAGELEIAVGSSDTAQRFAAGAVFIAGDLHGKGHTTRAIQAGRALVVNLRG